MAAASWIQHTYLTHFSKPQADRRLFRLVKKNRVGKIFELGVSNLDRSLRLIQVAQRFSDGRTVKYAAVDLFDVRPEQREPLSLIQAHRALQGTSATVRLVPGKPAGLTGVANSHQGTDLLLIADWISDSELAALWYFVPRMLTKDSVVVRARRADDGQSGYQLYSRQDVQRLADLKVPRAA